MSHLAILGLRQVRGKAWVIRQFLSLMTFFFSFLSKDHSLVVSTLADQCPDAKLMLFGDYNLSKIAWSSSLPLRAECTSYVDPNGIDAVNHVASVFTCLSLKQFFPAHPSKGYTLDLLFSNVDSIFVSDPPDDFVFKSNDNHCPKLFSFPHKSFASLKPKLFYKNFFSCDYGPIITRLSGIEWSSLFKDKSLDEMVDILSEELNEVVAELVPTSCERPTPIFLFGMIWSSSKLQWIKDSITSCGNLMVK